MAGCGKAPIRMMHESGDLPFLSEFQFFGDWEDETIAKIFFCLFSYRLIRPIPGRIFLFYNTTRKGEVNDYNDYKRSWNRKLAFNKERLYDFY